jgi:hypothetical protein
MPTNGGPGDTPYPIRQAMGQLKSQLTGLKNRIVGVFTAVRDFVVGDVIGNDNIGAVVDAAELAGQPSVNAGGNSALTELGKVAGKVGPVLTVAEGVKVMVNLDAGNPESVRDIAKFTVEVAVGATVPAASVPVTILLNNARKEGGLTNPDNHEQLSGAFSSSYDQTRAGNVHLQKALQQQKKKDNPK